MESSPDFGGWSRDLPYLYESLKKLPKALLLSYFLCLILSAKRKSLTSLFTSSLVWRLLSRLLWPLFSAGESLSSRPWGVWVRLESCNIWNWNSIWRALARIFREVASSPLTFSGIGRMSLLALLKHPLRTIFLGKLSNLIHCLLPTCNHNSSLLPQSILTQLDFVENLFALVLMCFIVHWQHSVLGGWVREEHSRKNIESRCCSRHKNGQIFKSLLFLYIYSNCLWFVEKNYKWIYIRVVEIQALMLTICVICLISHNDYQLCLQLFKSTKVTL